MKRKLHLMAVLWPVLTIMCLEARAQQQETHAVAGKVISAADGGAIVGATVTNKRTRIHAVTDRLGEYRIPARRDDILAYSFVGYETTEEKIGGREWIIVALDSAENTLQEVEINAGYYTTTRKTSTGNIARVGAETIARQPVLNVLEALKGQMPGVDIQQVSGDPGAPFVIRIRGENSLRLDGNEPLYLVDGVPYPSFSLHTGTTTQSGSNPLNSLNPGDIASVEVLKDADATAIYGSRGSNGVVLISTKRGEAGKTRVQFGADYGLGKIRKFVSLLSTAQYLSMREEAFNESGIVKTTANAPDLLLWEKDRYTDWQRELLGGTAGSHSVRVSASGGEKSVRYLLAANYKNQGNVYPRKYTYERGGAQLNLQQGEPHDRLSMQLSLNYNSDNNDMPILSLASLATSLSPNAPAPYLADGTLNWENGTYINPMANLHMDYNSISHAVNTHIQLSYRLSDRVTVKGSGGYNLLAVKERHHYPESAFNPTWGEISRVTLFQSSQRSWIFEPQVLYDQKLGVGRLQGQLGMSMQHTGRLADGLQGTGFLNEGLMHDITQAAALLPLDYELSTYRYMAIFARVNYNANNKYIANLTARRDGSSRFGPGKRWGNFGAVGGAWVFAAEPFISDNVGWLSSGKLRSSIGVTGSDQIDDYGFLSTYQGYGGALMYHMPYLLPTRLANADFRWETNKKLEVALEVGFLQDRLLANTVWYRNRSGNQLVGYPLAAINGFSTVQYNLPALLENSGWEFELHASLLRSSPLKWEMTLLASAPKRKLLAYPNIEASSYSATYLVGHPTSTSLRYVYTGVDRETGEHSYADQNGDDRITTADRQWKSVGNTYYGSIQQQFSWKWLELSVAVLADRRPRNRRPAFALPGTMNNQPIAVMERWRRVGDETSVQRFWPTGSGNVNTAYTRLALSDALIKDWFFMRLSNLCLRASLPEKINAALRLRSMAVMLQGQNLWVSENPNVLDPETLFGQLPPLRMFNFSIQCTF